MTKKGSNKKETVEETDKSIENEEKVEETPVVQEKIVEKIIEKPLDLAEKSPQELAQFQLDIKNQEIQNHLNAESQRIKDIICPKCGKNLKLKPKDYMKKDGKPQSVECKSCESLVKVYVKYKDEPELSNAEITVRNGGYVWINQVPSTWEDKHTIKWVEMEKERLEKNQSVLSPDNQKLFRVQILILQKLKVIK